MIPKNLIFLFLAFILNLILLTCLRLVFFAYFKPAETEWLSPALLRSLYLGLRFDSRGFPACGSMERDGEGSSFRDIFISFLLSFC
jgi:hypothetical protein